MLRLVDILIASVISVLTLPVVLIAGILVKVHDGGPMFFRQERLGKGGGAFKLIKLRSMSVANKGAAITSANDSRITPIGKWLRLLKLDELPQFYNVLLGHMSIVGPRPEVRKYVEIYPSRFNRLLKHRPGITSEASLAFRHENEILARQENAEQYYIDVLLPEKIRMDTEMVEHLTIPKYFGIIMKTALQVLNVSTA